MAASFGASWYVVLLKHGDLYSVFNLNYLVESKVQKEAIKKFIKQHEFDGNELEISFKVLYSTCSEIKSGIYYERYVETLIANGDKPFGEEVLTEEQYPLCLV